MALADYQPDYRVIHVGASSFQVFGLALTEITELVRHHLPDLEALFDLGQQVVGNKVELTEDDLAKLAVALTHQVPGFVANLIALATHEKGEAVVENAAKLPFPVQIKALVEIAEVTFSEVGGVKKALESVAGLLNKRNLTVTKNTQ